MTPQEAARRIRERASDKAVAAILSEQCPEWCNHEGQCAADRDAITRAERAAENAWLVAAEAGYPGYDYDPNDPRAMDR